MGGKARDDGAEERCSRLKPGSVLLQRERERARERERERERERVGGVGDLVLPSSLPALSDSN